MGMKPSWVGSSEEFNNKQIANELKRLKKIIPQLIGEVYKQYYRDLKFNKIHYLTDRHGAFDFPEEDDWIKERVNLFFRNFSEEYGLCYENGKLF
jgi:hypothetical protein